MKTIGVLGGMSWESTAHYYRVLNETVRERAGGLHSADILLHSVDFAPIAAMQAQDDWDAAAVTLGSAARGLAAAGADFLVIATNTMHIVAPQIEAAAGIPVLHIADPTADAAIAAGVTTLGLLGTRFTMEKDFYTRRLQERGLTALVPEAADRDTVHRIIYDELVLGIVRDESRAEYRAVIQRLIDRGAGGIIYGCTEIMMLVGPDDASVPTFDTTELHALAAVERSLADDSELSPS
ncbi:MAG: aspartate/glutamate racemase family protein [Microbacteriaceae bacterium]